jgi:hypothetical protein
MTSTDPAGGGSRSLVDHVPVLWVQPAPPQPAAPLALWLPHWPGPSRTPSRSCDGWQRRASWRSASTRGSTASVAPNQASRSPSASSATSGGTCGRSSGRPPWTRCGSPTGQWPRSAAAPGSSPGACPWAGTSPWRWPASTSGSAGLAPSSPRPAGPAQPPPRLRARPGGHLRVRRRRHPRPARWSAALPGRPARGLPGRGRAGPGHRTSRCRAPGWGAAPGTGTELPGLVPGIASSRSVKGATAP